MKLARHDIETALWRKLESYLEQRMETLRQTNDGDLDPMQTARLRGRIAELKSMLALSKDEPTVAAEDS